ncbi:MAG: oxidoreductase [Bacteroidota bacterium]
MKVWFITGCSTGFGRELAKVAAAKGDFVAGTLRKREQMADFESLAPGQMMALLLDVTKPEDIQAGVKQVLEAQGRIDILVNNAGYGSIGPIEEVSGDELRRQFDVNVFGAVDLIRAVLPSMRAQQSGHIINVTSIAGLRANPGLGIYNGSKFALEGIGEALAPEVAHLGIKVTNVEPGPFRTEWAGRSATYSDVNIPDYEASAGKTIHYLRRISGQQQGDPVKGAEAMYALTQLDNPPVHLPLGEVAYRRLREKLAIITKEVDEFESLGLPTDYE